MNSKLKNNGNWLIPLFGAIVLFCVLFGGLCVDIGTPKEAVVFSWRHIYAFTVLCLWFYSTGYAVGKYLNKE
jgi:hypothetical protein